MGKRSRDEPSEHESSNFEHMAKKFKELERVFLHAQRNHEREHQKPPQSPPPESGSSSSSSSASSSRASSRAASPAPSAGSGRSSGSSPARSRSASRSRSRSGSPPASPAAETTSATTQKEQEDNEDRPTTKIYEARPSTSTAKDAPLTSASEPAATAHTTLPAPQTEPQTSAGLQPAPAELDEELLKILGEDPSKTKACGKDIQSDLAVRLQHIATSGLSKETRKELLDKYLPPGNCALIDAPDLNPEVKAAVSETIYKRDKAIKTKQKQVTSAIACVAEALTVLLSAEQKDMTLIKVLMDASKLLCDCQNQDSTTRRNFVLYNLKKELKDQLQATKIDKYLFSKDLADTLKAAKAISKSGADMKPATATPQAKKPNKQSHFQPQKNLNWRAPPSTQRPKGTPRKEPARKGRPDYSSRASSRPAPPPPPPPPGPSRSRR